MSNYDDRSVEIDEFAMFQARSMGVETEYLEMAKAGRRLGGRSPRCQRPTGEGASPPSAAAASNASSSVGSRARKPRSADGRHRSARFEGHPGREEKVSTPRPRKHCSGLDDGDPNCGEAPGPNRQGSEDDDDDDDYSRHRRRLEAIADGEEVEVEVEEVESQSLNRSHSFRTRRMEGEKKDRENAPPADGSGESSGGGLEVVKTDLKRTLTMPAKRHRGSAGRESVRSWSRPPEDAPAPADPEPPPPPWSGHHSCDGATQHRSNKSWKDGGGGGGGGHGGGGAPSVHGGGPTAGKKACLIRHDSGSSSSHCRTHHTPPDRASTDGVGGGGGGGGGGRVLASRVERPGTEVSVYRVLVLGSQGVGKSTVTQQLLSVGDDDNEDDDSSDRIVCVQVDEEESYLEFIDGSTCQVNRSKQGFDANLVVYSVTDRSSFVFAQSCLQELRPAKRHNVVILVANKQDLVRNRIISEDDGKSLAAKRHCKFIEVSALLSLKMEDLLVGIARQIRLRKGRASSAAAAAAAPSAGDRGTNGPSAASDGGAFDTGLGCLQRAALRAIRKVFRRRPVESTSCDNLCTP